MTSVPPPAYVHPGPPPELPERPEGLPPLRSGADRWKPWTAWLAIAASLAIPLVLGIFAAGFVVAGGGEADEFPPGVLIGLTFLQDIGFIVVPLLLATWLATRPTPLDFGIRRPDRIWIAIGLLFAVYVSFILLSGIWVEALGIEQEDTLPDELGVKDSTVNLVLVLILVTVMAPVGEEVLFRGYIYRALRNWQGVWPAAIISGLLFGGIHVGSSPIGFIVPLAILGVGLALLYHWTGSLYLPVALHALNNSIAFGASQDWGWQIAATIPAALAVSLGALWLLGRALGRRRAAGAGIAPAG